MWRSWNTFTTVQKCYLQVALNNSPNKSCSWYFSWNIITAYFLNRTPLWQQKMKSGDELLLLDDFYLHLKYIRARLTVTVQNLHPAKNPPLLWENLYNLRIYTQVLLGISHLYGDTPFGGCRWGRRSLCSNHVDFDFIFTISLLFSPFNNKAREQQLRQGFPSSPQRRVRDHDQACHGSSGWKVSITTCSQQQALGSTEAPISRTKAWWNGLLSLSIQFPGLKARVAWKSLYLSWYFQMSYSYETYFSSTDCRVFP